MKKKIRVSVVLGGAGFIGSHLCERLLERGDRVLCVDNMLTGDMRNVEHLLTDKSFIFLRHDITQPFYPEGKVDAIYHLASPASPVDYLKLPIQTLKAGSMGTHNALGIARASQASFLLASTSEVYGDPLVHPQPETYWGNVNPIGPRGVYDEAKRFAEAMTMAYRRTHGVRTRIARIFNTYGPRMRPLDGRVVPAFLMQALRGEPLTVFGSGGQTRSFCYVSDLVGGLMALMESDESDPVNLGNPREMTILEFAEVILRMTGGGSKITFAPLPVDDPRTRRPDIARARTLLGWEPKVALEQGLVPTIEYFRRIHAAGK